MLIESHELRVWKLIVYRHMRAYVSTESKPNWKAQFKQHLNSRRPILKLVENVQNITLVVYHMIFSEVVIGRMQYDASSIFCFFYSSRIFQNENNKKEIPSNSVYSLSIYLLVTHCGNSLLYFSPFLKITILKYFFIDYDPW